VFFFSPFDQGIKVSSLKAFDYYSIHKWLNLFLSAIEMEKITAEISHAEHNLFQ